MKLITTLATGLACSLALTACATEQSTVSGENKASTATLIELSSGIRTVDVTQDTSRRFGAPHIAVNPRDPNNIVVLASSNMGYTRDCLPPVEGSDCEGIEVAGFPRPRPRGYTQTPGFMDIGVFVSHDRGQTFTQADISDLVPPDDPMVRSRGEGPIAVTPDGTFYVGFNAINWGDWDANPPTFFPNGGVGVIKSSDGGRSWEWANYSGTPANWPYGGTDSITGTFYVTSGIAGRTALGPRSTGNPDAPDGPITDRWVSSTEDGHTWTAPAPLGANDGDRHVGGGHSSVDAAYGIMATMFVSDPDSCSSLLDIEATSECVIFQTSTDAGKTWQRTQVPTPENFKTAPLSHFVSANPSREGHFTATLQSASGSGFLVFHTSDSGKTWSGPASVGNGPDKAHFSPYVATSPRGEFGLMWRSREPDPNNPQASAPHLPYSVWAAVSRDGGLTFSKPLKVSQSNSPAPPSDPQDVFRIVGDHGPSGIAIDGHGAVHVVWADWSPGERAIFASTLAIDLFERQ